MKDGGSISGELLRYNKVVPNYNFDGTDKAALEALMPLLRS